MSVTALEFKTIKPVEFKFSSESGILQGYGSTFGNVDLGGDVCAQGCFAKSLSEHKVAGTMPAMLWSHDPSEPLGVWTEAAEDAKGLRLEGKLTLGTQRGAEARALAKDGALALSIGYATRDAVYDKGRRVLKELELFEVSTVAMPMNPEAQIVELQSAAQAANEMPDRVAFEPFPH